MPNIKKKKITVTYKKGQVNYEVADTENQNRKFHLYKIPILL